MANPNRRTVLSQIGSIGSIGIISNGIISGTAAASSKDSEVLDIKIIG
jgi:hypothetical protein